MAFTAGNFNASFSLKARAGGTQRWKYDGGSDTVATMIAADYFLTEYQRLSVGDFINVIHDNGTIALKVLTSAVGGVTTTPHGSASGLVSAGAATLTLTEPLHAGITVINDQTAGLAITMAASTGNGAIYRIINGAVSATANTITCAGSDVFDGNIMVGLSLAQTALFHSDGTDTIITQNLTTTGLGDIGDWVEIQDIVSGKFAVRGQFSASGTVATPFS